VSENKGILVFCEDCEGRFKNVTFELLSKACEISEVIGEKVTAVTFCDTDDLLRLAQYGADEIVVINTESGTFSDIETNIDSAVQIITKYSPSMVFFGATDIGRIVAPGVAAQLRCGITADCTEFSINKEGKLVQIRPALGGNILAHIVSSDTYPQMATARPSVFRPVVKKVSFRKTVITPESKSVRQISLLKVKKRDAAAENKIEDALKVISVGIGLKQKILPKVWKLAGLIGATVSCSRKVVEAGWLPHSVQVGQSGKTISPELYIALGISGASQHLAGMKTSKEIIAVNSDPDADIFSVAHTGFAADVDKWLDAVIASIEKVDE
jgi:electron transfer flavoprotein alpha subunit